MKQSNIDSAQFGRGGEELYVLPVTIRKQMLIVRRLIIQGVVYFDKNNSNMILVHL